MFKKFIKSIGKCFSDFFSIIPYDEIDTKYELQDLLFALKERNARYHQRKRAKRIRQAKLRNKFYHIS